MECRLPSAGPQLSAWTPSAHHQMVDVHECPSSSQCEHGQPATLPPQHPSQAQPTCLCPSGGPIDEAQAMGLKWAVLSWTSQSCQTKPFSENPLEEEGGAFGSLFYFFLEPANCMGDSPWTTPSPGKHPPLVVWHRATKTGGACIAVNAPHPHGNGDGWWLVRWSQCEA